MEVYGHDVIHVLDRFNPGENDENVFRLALKEHRTLITLNGKHFIIFIPPMAELNLHYGLIWLRGFQVTNKSYKNIMSVIGEFLGNKGGFIKNTYYMVKKKGDTYEVSRRYPRIDQ